MFNPVKMMKKILQKITTRSLTKSPHFLTEIMLFSQALVAAGYSFNDEEYDDAYVKTDSEGYIHIYQMGEDQGEWNYVKMSPDYDVLKEVTFDPDTTSATVVK